MTGQGRPLRFLALVVLAWVGARVAMLWPRTGSLPAAIQAVLPIAHAAPSLTKAAKPVPVSVAATPRAQSHLPPPHYIAPLSDEDPRVQLALMGLVQYGEPGWAPMAPASRTALPARAMPLPERLAPLPDRWSLSGWMVARGSGGAAAAPGGQPGCSRHASGSRSMPAPPPRSRAGVVRRRWEWNGNRRVRRCA